ncbi:MAG: hypothetical protein AAFQ98_21055 [Bacteroidota bacterium]
MVLFFILLGVTGVINVPTYWNSQTQEIQWLLFSRNLVSIAVGIVGLLLARGGYIQGAKILLTVAIPSLIIFGPLLQGNFLPFDIYWLPIMSIVHPALPHLLLDQKKEARAFWTAIIFCLFVWASTDWVIFSQTPGGLDAFPALQENYYLYKGTTLFYFLLVNAAFFYLNRNNQRFESGLEQKVKEVQEQKEKIATQNEELVEQRALIEEQLDELRQHQEEVEQINEKLEFMVQKRTQELEVQNHQLAEYAFINGNLLRAPLSRVQGLIYLMELSQKIEEDDPMYVHLKESVEEFSEVVFHINRLVEEGKHFDRYDFAKSLKAKNEGEDAATS